MSIRGCYGIAPSISLHKLLSFAGKVDLECPALPGCVSQGKDEQEALANIKEAISAWLWAEDQKAMAQIPPSNQPEILVSV